MDRVGSPKSYHKDQQDPGRERERDVLSTWPLYGVMRMDQHNRTISFGRLMSDSMEYPLAGLYMPVRCRC
jgi:hypothetical protein